MNLSISSLGFGGVGAAVIKVSVRTADRRRLRLGNLVLFVSPARNSASTGFRLDDEVAVSRPHLCGRRQQLRLLLRARNRCRCAEDFRIRALGGGRGARRCPCLVLQRLRVARAFGLHVLNDPHHDDRARRPGLDLRRGGRGGDPDRIAACAGVVPRIRERDARPDTDHLHGLFPPRPGSHAVGDDCCTK